MWKCFRSSDGDCAPSFSGSSERRGESNTTGRSLWSAECLRERNGKPAEVGCFRGGNAYTSLSSRGEVGHAVNERPRPCCGVVGDRRLNVNVAVEFDCELPEDSLPSLQKP